MIFWKLPFWDFKTRCFTPAPASLKQNPFSAVMLLGVFASSLLLAGCSGGESMRESKFSKKVVTDGKRVPKGGGYFKIGKPYQINGKWYRPRRQPGYNRVGMASWYGDMFHGRLTANGEVFDMHALTAAHPTLPLPSLVRVTNLENGKVLVVRVNDRGPYRHNRVIDLSKRVASILGFKKKGTARVKVKYLGKAPLNGDDSYERSQVASFVKRTNDSLLAGTYSNIVSHDRRRTKVKSQDWRSQVLDPLAY